MKSLYILLLSAFAAAISISSCKKSNVLPDTPCHSASIAELVECGGLPETESPLVVSRDTTVTDFNFSSNWICEEIEVDAAGAVGEYRTFDPNSDVVWPGNLLQGKSLDKATPDAIKVKRAGGRFTINLVNGSQFTNQTVDEVNQGNVIAAINRIIEENNGVLAANFNYTERQVRSKEELALNLGVKVNTLTTDFSSKLSFSSDRQYNRFLVDFVQQYYTISYETPTSYDEVFAPSVKPEDLMPFIGENNPPVFIKSVTYGRRFYLLIESTASASEMRASIRASYDAGLTSGQISGGSRYVNELSDVQIKVFAMGGDASLAAAAFRGDLGALHEFLTEGGAIETGAPLSYKMNALAPPYQTVGVNVASRFTVPNCHPAYNMKPPAFIHAWHGVFGAEGIGAACAIDPDQSNVLLFSKDGERYAQIVNGAVQNIYGLEEQEGRLAGCPFDAVSAAQIFNETIFVFDREGKNYATLNTNGAWSPVFPLSVWGADGQHPFLNPSAGEAGVVGAALFYTGGRSIHFNSLGTKWAVYNPTVGGGTFGPVSSLEDWGGNVFFIPFPSVGAALQVRTNEQIFDGLTGYQYYQILFNKDGTRFAIYHGQKGFTDVYDLVVPD